MASIEVGSVVAEVTAQIGAIVAVGGAVLAVLVARKAFKWVRAALLDGGTPGASDSNYEDEQYDAVMDWYYSGGYVDAESNSEDIRQSEGAEQDHGSDAYDDPRGG